MGAIGVRVVRWVTMHGTAFNVSPDLDHLDAIVPCGLHGEPVTSVERETGRAPELAAAAELFAGHFGEVFGTRWLAGPWPDLPQAQPMATAHGALLDEGAHAAVERAVRHAANNN